MRKQWYALAGIGVALAVAGCGGSSTKTAAGGSASQSASATSSTASAVSPTANSTTGGTPGLTLHRSEFGHVIFDSSRHVLYEFAADHGTTSTCYGVCASAWPPMLSKGTTPSVGPGLNAALLGTTKRNDGMLQVTYAGHPLYYYSGDTSGKVSCQAQNMHGGFWYVVNADGSANKMKGHGMMRMNSHENMKGHENMKEMKKMKEMERMKEHKKM